MGNMVRWLFLGACLVAAACGGATAPSLRGGAFPHGETLRAELERFRERNGLPGLAVVTIERDRISVASAGVRRVDALTPLSAFDEFQMGSLTKAATATLLARLIERGQLRWDSTLAQVFPQWRARMRPEYLEVTVEQLLRHHAGLPMEMDDEDMATLRPRLSGDARTDRAMFGWWALQQKPARARGTPGYSNLGYVLAGLVAEAAGGDSYERLMDQHVFGPLGVAARFGFPEDEGLASPTGHTARGSQWQVVADEPGRHADIFALSAAGGMVTSLGDYGLLLREHLLSLQGRSRFLSQDSAQRMHTPQDGFGMGWDVSEVGAVGPVSAHTGSFDSYYGAVFVIPGQDRAIALMCNCASALSNTQVDQLLLMLAGLLPERAS